MSTFLPLFAIHLLALMTPGPDFLVVSKAAMRASRRSALFTAVGVTAGCLCWTLLAVLGLHWLFETFSWLQTALKVAGGAYLLYLGMKMLWASFASTDASETPVIVASQNDLLAFSSGLVTNLANPKVLVYYGSIFATFFTGSIALPEKTFVLTLLTMESLLWFVLVATLFSLPTPRRAYKSANTWIDRIAGLAFSGFGLRLIFSNKH